MSILHNENHIGILNGRETVGYNKAGTSFHHFCKSILNLLFCTGINRRSCLIKNQHSRQIKHDSCNTKKLFLSLTHSGSIFRNIRIKTLWHLFNEAIGMCFFCSSNNLLIGKTFSSHCDIVTNCSTSKPGIL